MTGLTVLLSNGLGSQGVTKEARPKLQPIRSQHVDQSEDTHLHFSHLKPAVSSIQRRHSPVTRSQFPMALSSMFREQSHLRHSLLSPCIPGNIDKSEYSTTLHMTILTNHIAGITPTSAMTALMRMLLPPVNPAQRTIVAENRAAVMSIKMTLRMITMMRSTMKWMI